MAKIEHLGKVATVIVGKGFREDGRKLTGDDILTAELKLAEHFRAGLTQLGPDGLGQWTDKATGKLVAETVRAYVVVGACQKALWEHADFIRKAFQQTAVFVVVGDDAYEVR